jgi:hypothetical protein
MLFWMSKINGLSLKSPASSLSGTESIRFEMAVGRSFAKAQSDSS